MGITKKDVTIIKRVLRDAPKNMHCGMDGAIPVKFNGEELIGFCDGHRILLSENDFDFPKVENPVNLLSVMSRVENHNFEKNGVMIEIDKDKVKEAKAQNRGRGTRNLLPFVIKTQYGRIGVNPSLLMDAIEFTKTNVMYVDKTIYSDKENGTYKRELYFVNEEEKRYSVTLPVNLGNTELREGLIVQEVSIPEQNKETANTNKKKEKKMKKAETKKETKKTEVKLGKSMKNVDLIAEAKKENGITIAVDTFNGWKRRGLRVKKGEKAVFKTAIWKPFKVKIEVEEGEEEKEKTKMRLINTAFFTENQVEEQSTK